MHWTYRVQQQLWWSLEHRTNSLLRYRWLDQVPLTCFRRRLAAERALHVPHRM